MTRYAQLGNHQTLYMVDPIGPPIGNITKASWSAANKWSILVPGAGTFFFPFGGERYGVGVETIHHSLSLIFDALLAGTFTLEGTNCPKTQSGNDIGGADVSDFDTSPAWQQIDITQAGLLYAVATGVGNSMSTKLTLTIGGTNAGGAFYNLPDLGCMRLRGKLVATHAGALRVAMQAKLGS